MSLYKTHDITGRLEKELHKIKKDLESIDMLINVSRYSNYNFKTNYHSNNLVVSTNQNLIMAPGYGEIALRRSNSWYSMTLINDLYNMMHWSFKQNELTILAGSLKFTIFTKEVRDVTLYYDDITYYNHTRHRYGVVKPLPKIVTDTEDQYFSFKRVPLPSEDFRKRLNSTTDKSFVHKLIKPFTGGSCYHTNSKVHFAFYYGFWICVGSLIARFSCEFDS